MTNCHHAPYSPPIPKIAQPPLPTKTIFDKTKLSVDGRQPKTTTYGRKCLFQPLSTAQDCTTSSGTSARLCPFPHGKGLGVRLPRAATFLRSRPSARPNRLSSCARPACLVMEDRQRPHFSS